MSVVRVMDTSSWQPANLSPLINLYQPDHVIVRLYLPWEVVSQNYSREQVKSAIGNGCTVGGYFWGYQDSSPVDSVNAALDLCAGMNLILPILWIDHEQYQSTPPPNAEWLRWAWAQCDALDTPSGLYTSRYQWELIGNPTEFSARPVWLADHNGDASLDVLAPPGLPFVVGHQYQGAPVDLSVMLKEYTTLPAVNLCAAAAAALDALITTPYRRPSKTKLKAVRALLE